jgi:hypothetical protein
MKPLKTSFALLENIHDSIKNGDQPFQFTRMKSGKPQTFTVSKRHEKIALLNTIIQAFLLAPQKAGESKIQAFTGSSAIPSFTDAAFSTFVDQRNYDLGWSSAFRTVDLLDLGAGRKQLSFNIATGQTGGTMMLVPEGGKVQFDGYKGSSLQVKISKYGMGFTVTWEMLQERNFNAFGDMLLDVSAQIYGTWADVHYGILQAAADATATVAYDTVGADVLEKDTNTLNSAIVALMEANKDKSTAVTGETTFVLYAHESMRARINRAIRGLITDERKVVLEYNIQPYFTMNSEILPSGGSKLQPIIGIPGRKTQNAIHTANLGFSEQDISSLSESKTHWTAFGAGVGDNAQWKRVIMG